jgi:hypothetical protein
MVKRESLAAISNLAQVDQWRKKPAQPALCCVDHDDDIMKGLLAADTVDCVFMKNPDIGILAAQCR